MDFFPIIGHPLTHPPPTPPPQPLPRLVNYAASESCNKPSISPKTQMKWHLTDVIMFHTRLCSTTHLYFEFVFGILPKTNINCLLHNYHYPEMLRQDLLLRCNLVLIFEERQRKKHRHHYHHLYHSPVL